MEYKCWKGERMERMKGRSKRAAKERGRAEGKDETLT